MPKQPDDTTDRRLTLDTRKIMSGRSFTEHPGAGGWVRASEACDRIPEGEGTCSDCKGYGSDCGLRWELPRCEAAQDGRKDCLKRSGWSGWSSWCGTCLNRRDYIAGKVGGHKVMNEWLGRDWPLASFRSLTNDPTRDDTGAKRMELARQSGRRSLARELASALIADLGDEDGDWEKRAARLALQLDSARAALRGVCADHGDNEWPDSLILSDVIEKHLGRHLDDPAGSDRSCPSGKPADRTTYLTLSSKSPFYAGWLLFIGGFDRPKEDPDADPEGWDMARGTPGLDIMRGVMIAERALGEGVNIEATVERSWW